MKYHLFWFCILLILVGCKQTSSLIQQPLASNSVPFPAYENLSDLDKERADTLLAKALDHEALYSLMSDLKPMSSIGFALSYPLGKDSTQTDGQHDIVPIKLDSIQTALAELRSWNRVLKALSFDDYQFLLVPFKQVWEGKRNLQILLCRTDLLDSLLLVHAPFFSQWGFTSGIDPAALLTAIEFEQKHDRYRAYGYLFGYPRHAVDFFVQASQEQQRTGEFVQRSFFHIPVHASESGYFTYALPKDFQPLALDSAKYYQASGVLEKYRELRPQFVNTAGNLKAVELYRNWWKRKNESKKSKSKEK